MSEINIDGTMSRQTFLLIQANLSGGSFWVNAEAVNSVILSHPEWDRTETKTWEEWEAEA